MTEPRNEELSERLSNEERALLFEPISFGPGSLRNRFVMAAMTRRKSPGGVPGAEVVNYYARRAAGGVGLIITEGTYIDHPAANGYADVPAFHGEAALDGWRRVADAVHKHGGKIAAQLWHVGSTRRGGTEPDPSVPGLGPVAIDKDGIRVVEAMSAADIQAVVESYGRAAQAAEKAGFDGIEIHGAHGYLIDEFLWTESNGRTDAYGGSLANRLRFAEEVVRCVRSSVSTSFPVIFRYSQWKMSDYNARIAQTPEELAFILSRLTDAGVDVFHASTRRFWLPAFDGSDKSLAAWTKAITGKKVIAVGSAGLNKPHESRFFQTSQSRQAGVADVGNVVAGLKRGDFDLIAAGRALLADPDWVAKIRRGDLDAITSVTPDAYEKLVG